MRLTCVVDIIDHSHCCGVSITSVYFPPAVDEHLDYSHSGAIENSLFLGTSLNTSLGAHVDSFRVELVDRRVYSLGKCCPTIFKVTFFKTHFFIHIVCESSHCSISPGLVF